jgi:DNA-binding NarL/FixJ family response regulator
MKSPAENAPEEAMPQESHEAIKKKVLFIDDDGLFLDCVRAELGENEKNVVYAECHSVADALQAIKDASPDVVFLDNTFSKEQENAGLIVADEIIATGQDIKIYSTSEGANSSVIQAYAARNIERVGKKLPAIKSAVLEEEK